MATQLDQTRLRVSAKLDPAERAKLGQYMTPDSVARFMASLIDEAGFVDASVLDPGAGIGALSAAFLDRWLEGSLDFASTGVTAYEIDDMLVDELSATFASYIVHASGLTVEVKQEDFLESGLNRFQFEGGPCFTHAIMNPPYGKILSRSRHRLLLRHAGVETSNLYSGFVALALKLLVPGGQLVAITPRSFCNGPYFRPFRQFVLARAALTRIHLFGSRRSAFSDDDVLQENVIFCLRKDIAQNDVLVSTSTDESFSDLTEQVCPFRRIVLSGDPDQFIHIPTSDTQDPLTASSRPLRRLADLGISVSTGPVVDFRARDYLREMPEQGCVPLLYPLHFRDQTVSWPQQGANKPNAIMALPETQKSLFPSGNYVLVRRFSSKEEARRISAVVVTPNMAPGEFLGFENHVNVVHVDRAGIEEDLAYGIMAFLNSTAVDQHFRAFSGHTQVNVSDLKRMPFPERAALTALGRWAKTRMPLSQDELDKRVAEAI